MDDVSWTPVDKVSQILAELVLQDSGSEIPLITYHHLENPKSCKWSSLVPAIQQYYSHQTDPTYPTLNEVPTATKIKVVTFEDWVKTLEASGEAKNVDVAKIPGLKLQEFYQGLAQSISNTQRL